MRREHLRSGAFAATFDVAKALGIVETSSDDPDVSGNVIAQTLMNAAGYISR
jgi:hypothetical protein